MPRPKTKPIHSSLVVALGAHGAAERAGVPVLQVYRQARERPELAKALALHKELAKLTLLLERQKQIRERLWATADKANQLWDEWRELRPSSRLAQGTSDAIKRAEILTFANRTPKGLRKTTGKKTK